MAQPVAAVVQAQGGQAGEVDGAGSGHDVGQDAVRVRGSGLFGRPRGGG